MSKFQLTRRSLLHAGVAAVAAPYIIRPAGAQSKEVYVGTYGGIWTDVENEVFFKPFTAETGITVKTVTPTNFAKLRAQVEFKNYEFDLTCVGHGEFIRAKEAGYTEPLNFKIINKDKLWPNAYYDDADAITICRLGTGMAYRTDKYPNGGPKNWADFWDIQKFPGPRALNQYSTRVTAFALLADGVKPSELYPLDIERAFKSLDKIKPHVKVWWTGGNQSQQLLQDGEVHMSMIWNDRAEEMTDRGDPVKYVVDGTLVGNTMYGVAKGCPNAENAMRLLEFMTRVEPNAEFSKRLHYVPGNPEALKLFTPAQLARIPNPLTNPNVVNIDGTWEAKNKGKLDERIAEWLTKR